MKTYSRFLISLAILVFGVGSTSTCLAVNVIGNGSFELPVQPGTTVGLHNEAAVPFWETNATNDLIEIWSNGFGSVVSADGTQHAELNATQVSTLYQDVTGIAINSTVGYSFAHRGRNGVDTLELRISDLGTDNAGGGVGPAADTILYSQQFSTGNNAWAQYGLGNIGPLTLGNDMRFEFASISAAGGNQAIGNFLDNVSFGIGVGVPEPSSCFLLISSLSALVLRRR
jgi:hypothetical protein